MSEQNAGSGGRKSQTIIIIALIAFVLCACLAVTGVLAWKFLPQLRPVATPTPAPASVVTVAATPIKPATSAPLATVIVVVTATPASPTQAPAAKPSATPVQGATAAAPTPQPAASESPLPEGVLFYDDFASESLSIDKGWGFATGDSADYVWSPNQVTIAVKKSDWIASVWPDGGYYDFAAETEARAIEGSWAEYGLLFRVGGEQNARTYYLFGITTDGTYHVWTKVNGQWSEVDVVSDTESAAIVKGKGSNKIGVIVDGNQIELYINRQLVETIWDDTIKEQGGIGLYVGTGDNDLARVSFYKLAVMEVDKAREGWDW